MIPLIFVIVNLVCWTLYLYAPSVATDYPLISKGLLEAGFNPPFAWQFKTAVGLGENALFILWSWPLDFLYGLLAKLGFGIDTIQIVLGFMPVVIISTYSLNSILKTYNLSFKARFTGILFYLLNTYILLLIDGGQINIALSYAFLPLSYFYFYKSTTSDLKSKIIAGLIISLSGFLDIRFIYLLLVVLALRFIFDLVLRKANFKGWLYSGIVTLVIFIALHFYWIWPVYNYGLELPASLSSTSNISFLSFAKLKHAVLLLQPHWFKNAFGVITETKKEFLLIPILAFLGVVLNRKNTEVYFWFLISIIGILLVKGSNPPFENLYSFLFTNLPGFFVFRDPSKLFFLICLGYSILIAFSIDKISKKIPAIVGLVTIYILFLASPVYLGKMTGLFSKPLNTESYVNIEKILQEDDTFGRVLWLPNRHKLAYSSLIHPIVEGDRIYSLRPFSLGNVGLYESQNFIREGLHIPQLLNLSAVEYIVYSYPDDSKKKLSDEEIKYFETFSGQLSNLEYLEKVYKDERVAMFKVKGTQEKFFIADNKIALLESDDIYNNFYYESKYNLKNNSFVINNEKNADFYYPSDYLATSPNESGWWKRESDDFTWLRNFLEQKYSITNHDLSFGGGYAICEGLCTFKIPEKVKSWSDVYIRKLVVYPELITRKLTGFGLVEDKVFEYKSSKFEWQKIEKGVQEIKLDQEVNIINVLSPYEPEADKISLVEGLSEAKVNYEMINPTHYKITVTNLEEPGYLVFAETFSPFWKLNDQTSYKVYDLYNGFDIEENGEYDLYFKPQGSLDFGFKVSLLSFIILVFAIIKLR